VIVVRYTRKYTVVDKSFDIKFLYKYTRVYDFFPSEKEYDFQTIIL